MTLLIIRLKNTTTYDLRYGVRGDGGGRELGVGSWVSVSPHTEKMLHNNSVWNGGREGSGNGKGVGSGSGVGREWVGRVAVGWRWVGGVLVVIWLWVSDE